MIYAIIVDGVVVNVAVADYPVENNWVEAGSESVYIGDTYDRSWGYSDFESSAVWQQIQEESRTSSHDYDSWSSNDTDWSSDW